MADDTQPQAPVPETAPQPAQPAAQPDGGTPAPLAADNTPQTYAPNMPQAKAPPQTADANINVADYLNGQGLDLVHVDATNKGLHTQITAKDRQTGQQYNLTEGSIKDALVKAGHLTPDSTVKFQENSINSPQTALNEPPKDLSYGENQRLAWSSDKGASDVLLNKYGPNRVSLTDGASSAAVQDSDGVWRKISPDFHDDSGSWNWGNFVQNMQQSQKGFAEMGAFAVGGAAVEAVAAPAFEAMGMTANIGASSIAGAAEGTGMVARAGAAALDYAPKALGSIGGGLASDTTNLYMGRVVGTTGEDPSETARTMMLHTVMNAALPGVVDSMAEHAVIPALKGTLNALSNLPSGAISTVARVMSMFGDGTATDIEHSITHAGEVSKVVDRITDMASSDIAEGASIGVSRNSYEASNAAAAKVIGEAGSAFSGTTYDAGKMSRNLNNWMDGETSKLVNGMDGNVKAEIQQNIPVQSIVASNEFRTALGAAGIPVNAMGRVAASDLMTLGNMTPLEASAAAKGINQAASTLDSLAHFDVTDPSAFKDLANMHATIESTKSLVKQMSTSGNGAMEQGGITEALTHLDATSTIISHGLPMDVRPQYMKLMQDYTAAGHATNAILGGALTKGSGEVMESAADRVAQLFQKSKSGTDSASAAMWKSLKMITPGSDQLEAKLQTAISAKYMFNYSTAPTSTLGGLTARAGAFFVRPALKSVVMGAGRAMNTAADIGAELAQNSGRAAANQATQQAVSSPAGDALKSALRAINHPTDFMDSNKSNRVIQAYINYKAVNGN